MELTQVVRRPVVSALDASRWCHLIDQQGVEAKQLALQMNPLQQLLVSPCFVLRRVNLESPVVLGTRALLC